MRRAHILAAALVCALLPAAPGFSFSLGSLLGSPVDAELVARVPQDKRGPMNLADYALACANQDVDLAALKEELAEKQANRASLQTKLAKVDARAAEIALDIVKQRAVMDAGLGQDEDNRRIMDDLAAERTKNQAERGRQQARLNQAERELRDLAERVAEKERTVTQFKARRSGGDKAAPAASTAPRPAASPAPARADDAQDVIVNAEPGAPAPAPAPAPEADLQN